MRDSEKEPKFSRREFLRLSGGVAGGLFLDQISPNWPEPQIKKDSPIEKEAPVRVYRPVFWGNRQRPEMALTFDDGFCRQSVATSLEVLRANEIKSSFFVIGRQLEAYPDLWQQAAIDGHEICNHTYSHTYLTSLSSEQIKKEIFRWEEAAKEVLGQDYLEKVKQKHPFIRFPGGAGHKDEQVLAAVAEAGYRPIAWSADTYYAILRHYDLKVDPVLPIAQEVADHVVGASQRGSIFLLHWNKWDTTCLETIAAGIKEKSLKMITVSEALSEIEDSKPE
ncbi:MAG: polysaccharide deacetylase family protein [Patescibacteria group bacterium]|jgi:peptidoglycan/xylan/chitin deacetylase (PgdA/CDA1 family)